MTQYWYNIKGEPITREEANYLLSRPHELMVTEDIVVPAGLLLTTYFTVLGHNPAQGPCPCGRPYLFETVITDDEKTIPLCRWHTKDEALEGHRYMLANMKIETVDVRAN